MAQLQPHRSQSADSEGEGEREKGVEEGGQGNVGARRGRISS